MANFTGGARYVSCGIAERVGVDLQIVLWKMIEEWKTAGINLDYLQIFELSMEFAFGNVYQKIVQRQEVPALSRAVYYPRIERPLNAQIWVIDDIDAITMLFPNEY